MAKAFWLQDKKKEEKEEYLAYLRSLPELKILKDQLEEAITSVQKGRLAADQYTAAWPHKQAASNGKEKALLTVLSWLDFT